MKEYRIIPLALSTIDIDLSVLTYRYNLGTKIKLPIYMWYIEGADKRILVDTGCDAKYATEHRPFPAEDVQSFEDALSSVGVKPDDIDIVIATHLQWDHIVNVCPNAKVVVQEEELRFALAPHPILAPTYHKDLFKDLHFVPVRGYHELEPGIELIPAPGHTPGCQAVSVNTAEGRAIITGFCATNANYEVPEEVKGIMPVVTPGIHLNAVDAFESALYIKGLADILIPIHEPSFMNVKSIP
jgi:glyoxylase-like metal-dependent hydrolase (beta-lactamase superfamily II)